MIRGMFMKTTNDFWAALDALVDSSEIIIDRPKGTAHPKYPDFLYQVDYGYLKNTASMDGAGIDVWVGTAGGRTVDAIMVTVDLLKKDSEIKILVSCTEEEKETIYLTHNETPCMKGILVRRGANNAECRRGFMHMNKLEIKKVDRGTDLAEQLICFVENFSWEEVKAHLLEDLRSWAFTDWETPFAAIVNGQIVGIASIRKSDYYPLPEIYPWVSSVFVSEDCRGHRISEKLIAFANSYAKELGFTRTYIPTAYTGLYEKYGYHYLRDIVNYGNETDRLYVKEI